MVIDEDDLHDRAGVVKVNHARRKTEELFVLHDQWDQVVDGGARKSAASRYVNPDIDIKETGSREVAREIVAGTGAGDHTARTGALRRRFLGGIVVPATGAHRDRSGCQLEGAYLGDYLARARARKTTGSIAVTGKAGGRDKRVIGYQILVRADDSAAPAKRAEEAVTIVKADVAASDHGIRVNQRRTLQDVGIGVIAGTAVEHTGKGVADLYPETS